MPPNGRAAAAAALRSDRRELPSNATGPRNTSETPGPRSRRVPGSTLTVSCGSKMRVASTLHVAGPERHERRRGSLELPRVRRDLSNFELGHVVGPELRSRQTRSHGVRVRAADDARIRGQMAAPGGNGHGTAARTRARSGYTMGSSSARTLPRRGSGSARGTTPTLG